MKKLVYILLSCLAVSSAKSQDADLKILAINDMHGAVQNFPKLAYLVDSIRSQHPDVLLFSAGDVRTGNPVNDMFYEPNLPMVELMNAVGFNMSTMGNHECDAGTESFANTVNKSAFPYVVANAYPADSLKLHIQPFSLFEHQGVRIAVLGLVQINEARMTPDANPANMRGIRFTKPEVEAEKYKWLRDQCEVFIGLTHLGIEQDTLFADEFPMFDLLICGHSHDVVEGMIRNGVMLVQAKRDVRFINEIDIKVRDGKVVSRSCKLHDIRKAGGESQKVREMVERFSNNPSLNRYLTEAVSPFSTREELGIMMADAHRFETEADIAIVNAGGVRYEDKEAGAIIVNDILRLDPFGNKLLCKEMTGAEIQAFLEEIPTFDGYGPAYVSGLKYTISRDRNNRFSVSLRDEEGKKFNMKKTYKVTMNSYMVSLSKLFDEADCTHTFKISEKTVIDYLEKQSAVDYSGRSNVTIVK